MNMVAALMGPTLVAKLQFWCGIKWSQPDPENPLYPKEPTTSSQAKKYKIQNKKIYWLALAGSELAGEAFYYIYFPTCAWLFDVHLSRKCLLMLASVMYIGQSLKDKLKWPRPTSPPVIRLDEAYETEYGMPSTHTMCAVTVPLALLLFLSPEYKFSSLQVLMLTTLWCGPVIFSRLYLGMHSIMDIIVGTTLSVFLVKLFLPLVSWFEKLQYSGSGSMSAVLTSVGFFLAWTIFQLDSNKDPKTGRRNWNTARGDTAEILGWCSGFLVGSSKLFFASSTATNSHLIAAANSNPFLRCLLRFAVGGAILGPSTFVIRKLLMHFFMRLNSEKDRAKAKKKCWVELPYKFLTTLFSSFMSVALITPFMQSYSLW